MRQRWEQVVAGVAAVAGLVILVSPSTSPFVATAKPAATKGTTGTDNCVEPSNATGNCAKTFGVKVGAIGPIYPTRLRQLPVTWSNPNNFDIEVESYSVAVSVPSGTSRSCPASSLVVPSSPVVPSPRIVVAGTGSTSTTVPVLLPNSTPEACQGVAFSVTVSATAVKR